MTFLAEAECQRNDWSFGETFRNQYVITREDQSGPGDWPSRKLGDWRMHRCPNLPYCELKLTSGRVVALVLGHAITPDGMILEGEHKLPIRARAADRLQRVEEFISKLAGRYVALLVIEKTARIYPDPTCGFGPVYHPKSGRVGTTAALVLDRPVRAPDELGIEQVKAGEARHLFGYTADAEVWRARSNHYIDLTDFSLHRFWPTAGCDFDTKRGQRAGIAEEITHKLGQNMRALSQRFSTALPITGGTDSRLLVAAAAKDLDRINHFFVYQTNWANSIDTSVALDIAQIFCLPLRVIAQDSPVFESAFTGFQFRQLMKQRHLRGGLEPDTAERGSIRATSLLPNGTVILRGNAAEMTRALRWHRNVFDNPHDTEFAMLKLDLDPARTKNYDWYVKHFEAWKAGLPEHAVPRIYDFLHTELWMPHTNSTGYMREPSHIFINPFNDRRLIELTTSVPPSARRRLRLVHDMIEHAAPSLQDLDFWGDRMRALREAG